MEIVERGVLSAAVPGTPRAVSTFPAFVVLADGSLLVTYSIGSGKDTDDLTIELRRSTDGGRTWTDPVTPFETTIDGRRGALKAAPITVLDGDHLIVAALWIDREAFPGQPLFNPETEGCLPMTVLLADSQDAGRTWTPWRIVPMPDDIGPPSLTNAILRLADGTLVLSIEFEQAVPGHVEVVPARGPPPLRRRWGDLVRPGDGPRGSDRADPELGPAWRDRPGRPARDLHLDLRLGDRHVPQRPAPDQRRRHRPVRAGRRPRVRRPAGASRGAARRSRRRRLGRPVRDEEHPRPAGRRDRRAVRRRDRGRRPPSRAPRSSGHPRPTRPTPPRRARSSWTWAPGRTASPSPRRCPTATSASCTTPPAPTAGRMCAGRACGSIDEPEASPLRVGPAAPRRWPRHRTAAGGPATAPTRRCGTGGPEPPGRSRSPGPRRPRSGR